MSTSPAQAATTRPCAYCGKPVSIRMNRCPFCREAVPEVRLSPRIGHPGRREIRRGLLYMLLGAVIYYFAGGYSGMSIPYSLNPMIAAYLPPALFLGGLAMCLYGVYLKFRS